MVLVRSARTQTTPRVSSIDALAAGLSLASRRLWLMIIPVVVDVMLWLMPRLSVESLLTRLFTQWDALIKAVYTPAQLAQLGDAIGYFHDSAAELGRQVNLAIALTAGWLAPTSALASAQSNRLLLISGGVLAPAGIGLNLPSASPLSSLTGVIEIDSIWGSLLVIGGLWLLAQVLATSFLSLAALSLNGAEVRHGEKSPSTGPAPIRVVRPPFFRLLGLYLVLNLLLFVVLWLLRIPLAAATALAMIFNSSLTAFLFVLVGGLTLWMTLSFLVSVFLVSDVMLIDGQGVWASIWQSIALTRSSGMRTFGFVILVNLLMLGARAAWGIIGQTPAGALVAILGNGFLCTAMVLASMVYYDGLRREWRAAAASKADV